MNRGTSDHVMAAFNWIPPLGALRAWRVGAAVYLLRISNVASLHLLPVGLPALGFALPLLAVAGFLVLRRQPAARIAIALAIVALPVMLVLSEPARPLWLPRYLLWSGAAFLVLAGVGAAWLARRRAVVAFAAAAALLLANLLPFYHAETAPRWDLAAAALAPELAAGAYVFLENHGEPMMLRAYLEGGDSALPDNRVLFNIGDSEAQLRAGAPVIAVYGYTGQGLTSKVSAFRTRVGQLGTPSAESRIGRGIVLLRFDPTRIRAAGSVDVDTGSNP
jgi:hypothetical protein